MSEKSTATLKQDVATLAMELVTAIADCRKDTGTKNICAHCTAKVESGLWRIINMPTDKQEAK